MMRVLDMITQRNSYVYNDEGCWFPDPEEADSFFHFEGVKFGLADEAVVISEAECWQYAQQFVDETVRNDDADATAIRLMLARVVK